MESSFADDAPQKKKLPRKPIRDWDGFDIARFFALFPIYSFALLAAGFLFIYGEKVAGKHKCMNLPLSQLFSVTEDPTPWLVMAIFWVVLGIMLAALLSSSLLRRAPPRVPAVPEIPLAIFAGFVFFLIPISMRYSEPFLPYLFVTLALLLFGYVLLHGRYLRRSWGLIPFVIGILSGLIAMSLATYAAVDMILGGLLCVR